MVAFQETMEENRKQEAEEGRDTFAFSLLIGARFLLNVYFLQQPVCGALPTCLLALRFLLFCAVHRGSLVYCTAT